TGFLFDPNDSDDIAAAFERFGSLTPPQKSRMSRSARQYVETNLSPSVFADRYESVIGASQKSARAA
ncbi:MAG: glycosyltransferase involved in cell wall biosynthesis, partial [Pirellulaceae bacterium]